MGSIVDYVTSPGISAMLWLLLGFVATYAITRWVTLSIRARSQNEAATGEADQEGAADGGGGPVKDVYIGGVHIHHQVWGILLLLACGMLEFRFQPHSPGVQLLALFFGIGAALTLDEFALWLHLDDVYWSTEGRKSIDAVMVTLVIAAALLAGATPLGVTRQKVDTIGIGLVSATIVINGALVLITLLKGKILTGLVGLVVPFVSLVGAIRLAKPESFWAGRRYDEAKLAKAHERFDADYFARRERIRDWVSGARLKA